MCPADPASRAAAAPRRRSRAAGSGPCQALTGGAAKSAPGLGRVQGDGALLSARTTGKGEGGRRGPRKSRQEGTQRGARPRGLEAQVWGRVDTSLDGAGTKLGRNFRREPGVLETRLVLTFLLACALLAAL